MAWTRREADAQSSAAAATPPPSFGRSPAGEETAWTPEEEPAYSWFSPPPAEVHDAEASDRFEDTNQFRAIKPSDSFPPFQAPAAPSPAPHHAAPEGVTRPESAPEPGTAPHLGEPGRHSLSRPAGQGAFSPQPDGPPQPVERSWSDSAAVQPDPVAGQSSAPQEPYATHEPSTAQDSYGAAEPGADPHAPAPEPSGHDAWPPPWTPPPNLEDRSRPWSLDPGVDPSGDAPSLDGSWPARQAAWPASAPETYGASQPNPIPEAYDPSHASAPSETRSAAQRQSADQTYGAAQSYDPAGAYNPSESYGQEPAPQPEQPGSVPGAPVLGAPVYDVPVRETPGHGYGTAGHARVHDGGTGGAPGGTAEGAGEPARTDAPARPAEPGDVPVWPPRLTGEEAPAAEGRHLHHEAPPVEHEAAAIEVADARAVWPLDSSAPQETASPAVDDPLPTAGLSDPARSAATAPSAPLGLTGWPQAQQSAPAAQPGDGLGTQPLGLPDPAVSQTGLHQPLPGTAFPGDAVSGDAPAGPAAMRDKAPSGPGALDQWGPGGGQGAPAEAVRSLWPRPEGDESQPGRAADEAIALAITPTSGFPPPEPGQHTLPIEEPSGAQPPQTPSSHTPHMTPGHMPPAAPQQNPASAPTTPFAFKPVTPPNGASKALPPGFDSLGSQPESDFDGPATTPQPKVPVLPGPPPDLPPVSQDDRGRPASGMAKRVLLAACGAVVIGAIGTAAFLAYTGQSTNGATTAAPADAPSAAGTPDVAEAPSTKPAATTILDSQKTDPRKMLLTEAFPESRVTVAGRTFRRVKIGSTDTCGQAATGTFAAALQKQKCSRVLRATYVDAKKQYAVTTGIAVLPTKQAALTVDRSKNLGTNQWFRGLDGTAETSTDRVTISGGYAAGMVWGRYIVFSYATYADGHTPDAKDKYLGPVSGAFRDHTAEVLERRITR